MNISLDFLITLHRNLKSVVVLLEKQIAHLKMVEMLEKNKDRHVSSR